ncbi:DNA-directed RNA polymerase I core subunit RPA190 [Sporobolomyces salmoneus]|uniref:DNA-directed RNA polymerase I core subunit RPA190 n=1 Tax=Sporobolomyces salmoneus TaxID=183962 RepID=UPI003181F292
MDIAHPVSSQITSVSFTYLSSKDIRNISVKQVTNPSLFDNLNNPNAGGLYDAAFGPLGKGDICSTCHLTSFDCPGHFGHIDLPAPVFHPLYMTQAFQILRGSCTYCHRFLVNDVQLLKQIARLTLLEHGHVVAALAIDQVFQPPATTPKSRAGGGKKAASAYQSIEDADQGESTDETTEEFKRRLQGFVETAIKGGKKVNGEMDRGRDEYKESGTVFDVRKRVIAEFLKSLSAKKRCEHCAAYSHRFRKEGHTKIIEYSLVAKQKGVHKALGIKRPNVLRDQALVLSKPKKASNGTQSDEEESDDDEAMQVDNEEEDEEEEEEDDDAIGNVRGRQTERIVTPDEVRAHLRRLFSNEEDLVTLIYAPHGPLARASKLPTAPSTSTSTDSRPTASPDIFFMDVVSVPPSRFRPAATMGDQKFENPQNGLLNAILRQSLVVKSTNDRLMRLLTNPEDAEFLGEDGKPKVDRARVTTQLYESLIELQSAVNSMVDSGKNPMRPGQGKQPPQGVKQLLEKKEGLFRKNMMGKRVNYAARSVISPDVNIETNEIGVPPVFARKLTFPEPVTPHNINQLRQMVINGPHQHPGASFIQLEDGNLVSLDRMTLEERTAQANKLLAPESSAPAQRLASSARPDVGLPPTRTPQINRKVYRHLQDGDIVILNRQPTLHKPSMMCHRVKVLKGEKTIRMHYANCNSYNADFDGDEMNMHFPQSLVAQAEARLIANTDNQYLVPTSGNPLRGLIQDHVVSGVWLTNKDTFFTREQYYQLIYGALRPEDDYSGEGTVKTVPPAIWKPKPLWTGKQIFRTLLKNIQPPSMAGIHFTSKGKVPASAWGIFPEEAEVLVDDSDLLTGIIDKAQIGASPYGLVHSVFELYGPEIAGKLLSILSRLLTKFLQSRAFSCRMDDLVLNAQGNADRRKMLTTVNKKGLDAALEYTGLSSADRTDPATADDLRARLEEILRDDYKLAGLDATVEGETNQVTTQLIKQCLPNGLVKPFPHNNMQTMTVSGAKGSNVNASQISCLLGQQSLEGRRVPTMVSGKTLPSFKAFETAPRAGGFVAGRFLTGIRPQEYYFHCMAGREGLIDTAVKTSRSGYLQRCLIKHLEGLRVHYDHTVRNADHSVLQFHYGEDSLDVTKQKHLHQFEFAIKNMESIVARYDPRAALEKVDQIENVVGESAMKQALKNPLVNDPLLSTLSPSTVAGAISEKYAKAIEDYIKSPKQRLIKPKKKSHLKEWPEFIKRETLLSQEHFRSLMHLRYMRSLVEPGEAVGLMASQGVGEPSTQMTLNTFHFAGHGAANVTLGIPRLREIVMTASQDIKTPTMNLPIIESVSDTRLKTFCQCSTRLVLSQVLDNVTVFERLSPKTAETNYSRQKTYTVRLNLFPRTDYEAEYSIKPEQIVTGIARTFVPMLDKAILKEIKQNDKEIKSQAGDMGKGKKESTRGGKSSAADEDGAGEADAGVVGRDDGEEIDGDADDERRKRQGDEEATYDEDEDDEEKEEDAEEALEAKFREDDEDKESSDEEDSDAESEDEEVVAKRTKAQSIERIKALERRVGDSSRYINKLTFDKEKGEFCEFELEFSSQAHKLLLVGIVEEVCRQAIIHEVPGIARCFVAKAANTNAADKRNAVTEGVNLRALWHFGHGIVDLDNISTNDVGAILRTYGVEAARSSIINEMSAVFSVYGIGVDYRHLTVIADYMTSEGGYKPFNRTGLSNNSSPFLKASFETTAAFVAEAALLGDFDNMVGPSARIVVGRTPESGTGAFAIRSVVEAAA